jgi:Zn-dependent protease with chaperone function
MFALRGIAVSLSLFWLSYCVLSLIAVLGWRYLLRLRNFEPQLSARLLFAARIIPLTISLAGVVALAAPSFLWLEPRGTDEEIGIAPLILSLCCLAFFVIALVRVVRAQSNTSRIISGWLRGARALDVGTAAPTFRTASGVPPLTLAGVCRPRLLLSESALALLTPDELQCAVRHEMAHIRFRDNLKKLTFQFAWFPGMRGLEKSWQHVAELAADDAAVSNETQALDLAAALIKLSRRAGSEPLPTISMGLVQGGSLNDRISRLLNWKNQKSRAAHEFPWIATPSTVVALLAMAAAYLPLLSQTHAFTEWLVR